MRARLAMIGLLAMTPLAVLVGWWLMPEPRINAANYDRIRDGMTLQEVEELFGQPGSRDVPDWLDMYVQPGEHGFSGPKAWKDGGCLIFVVFDEDQVCGKGIAEATLWERIDDWYHGLDPWRRLSIGGKAKRLDAAA